MTPGTVRRTPSCFAFVCPSGWPPKDPNGGPQNSQKQALTVKNAYFVKPLFSMLGVRFPHASRGLHRLEAFRTELRRELRSGPSPEGVRKGPPEGHPNRPKRVSYVKNACFCKACLRQLWASWPPVGDPLGALLGPKWSHPRGTQRPKRHRRRCKTRRSSACLLKRFENYLFQNVHTVETRRPF